MPNERPEDYAPPEQRAAAQQQREKEMLRAVENAVEDARDVVQESEPTKVQDFAQLGAQAILRYAEASAMACEQTGNEVMQDAERLREECFALAEDIRHVAKVQAAAVGRAMGRSKDAAQGVIVLRKAFHEDISRERTEIEAAKSRATS